MSSARTKRRRLQKELETLLNESNVSNNNNSSCNLEISIDNSYCFDDIDGLVDSYSDGYLSYDPLSSSDFDEFVPEFNLKSSLAEWAIQNNITSVAVDQLLHILKKSNPNAGLPSSSKTLLKTPVDYQIQSFANGQYYHFGINRKLKGLTTKSLELQCIRNNTISISLSIDGLPISRSSKKSFWPILGRIADAPARSYVKRIISHNGFFGCERCTTRGIYERTVTFPELNAPLRTDESFRNRDQSEHHQGFSKLLDLGIGMTTQFPLDYLHQICLGITKKMIHIWCKGQIPYKESKQHVDYLSGKLSSYKIYFPVEFNRKPRGINELEY
ncbi:hypothetical protein Fcan01_11368 [Folsomia candida]|uniref:Uncharacterized protein n=1 Tax=Folsomia candida TaxID=158441 RepID=A0A226E8L3_FOLCA|nr:hypothetical protein Fcan01_11368 [Folsomia candida]